MTRRLFLFGVLSLVAISSVQAGLFDFNKSQTFGPHDETKSPCKGAKEFSRLVKKFDDESPTRKSEALFSGVGSLMAATAGTWCGWRGVQMLAYLHCHETNNGFIDVGPFFLMSGVTSLAMASALYVVAYNLGEDAYQLSRSPVERAVAEACPHCLHANVLRDANLATALGVAKVNELKSLLAQKA